MIKCDVIIPIYNAYDCLAPCIDSIIKNTEFESNRLILIDDKSPDKKVFPLLKSYAKKYPFIEVLQNEENLGFVGTVNRGMKSSNNDVLLLNSDTEVTKGWLDKIKKCAYSMPKVATVTPLSNNATLASVPKCFEPNNLPEGMTLEEMGELVEKCSKRYYPEIPTGHGFCLYIKREALDEVGYFDEESFGKGYGEENDFCFRCLSKGYRHLLCDDTYIYHKESQSFSDSKKELMKNASTILSKKHPKYCDRLNYWCSIKSIKYIGENITLSLEIQKQRPNILFIIHDWKDVKQNLGGTTLHAYDLIQCMRDKYNFHVFAPNDGFYKVFSYWETYETVTTYPRVSEFHDIYYYNNEYKKILNDVVKDFGIGLVHIHHLIANYFDAIDVIKENKLYSILSLHDYYSVCPLINKMYKNKEYCDNPSLQKCNECLKAVLKTEQNIVNWRTEWQRVLDSVDVIITPSQTAVDEIHKNYQNNIKIIEHGVNLKKQKAKYIEEKHKYNIAFIGAIGIHKGSKILEEFMRNSNLKRTKVHLFGIIDSQYQKDTRTFINHGKYKRNELNGLLKKNNIDLICLFSTCLETYSYTLTEAVACGVPVITFNFGAIAERVNKYGLGWTVDRNSSIEEITERINEILRNPTEYNKVIDNINKYKIRTVKEMCQEYLKLYDGKVSNKKIDVDHLSVLNKDNNRYYNNAVYNNYAWVFDTLKWKIISKFKFPKFVKRMINKNKED